MKLQSLNMSDLRWEDYVRLDYLYGSKIIRKEEEGWRVQNNKMIATQPIFAEFETERTEKERVLS